MQGHFITSWFRISLVNPLFCAPDCLLWRTLLWCAPDCRYGKLYSGVRLTAAMANSTLVCAWLPLWRTLLFCAPYCCYGELYSGNWLTAASVNSTLVCILLPLRWTLLWCMPDCHYGEHTVLLTQGIRQLHYYAYSDGKMQPCLALSIGHSLLNDILCFKFARIVC